MAVVGAQLTLGTALSSLQADAAAGLVRIPVAEEFPQCVATQVSDGMKFTGDLAGLIFVAKHTNLQESIFWWWRIDGQAAESLHMRLRLPGVVLHSEVVLF